MDADKVLEILSPKLDDFYKKRLITWLESHETYGILKRKNKFKVKSTPYGKGYVVNDLHSHAFVIVYERDAFMSK